MKIYIIAHNLPWSKPDKTLPIPYLKGLKFDVGIKVLIFYAHNARVA